MSVYNGTERCGIGTRCSLRSTRSEYQEKDIPLWLAPSQEFGNRAEGQG